MDYHKVHHSKTIFWSSQAISPQDFILSLLQLLILLVIPHLKLLDYQLLRANLVLELTLELMLELMLELIPMLDQLYPSIKDFLKFWAPIQQFLNIKLNIKEILILLLISQLELPEIISTQMLFKSTELLKFLRPIETPSLLTMSLWLLLLKDIKLPWNQSPIYWKLLTKLEPIKLKPKLILPFTLTDMKLLLKNKDKLKKPLFLLKLKSPKSDQLLMPLKINSEVLMLKSLMFKQRLLILRLEIKNLITLLMKMKPKELLLLLNLLILMIKLKIWLNKEDSTKTDVLKLKPTLIKLKLNSKKKEMLWLTFKITLP